MRTVAAPLSIGVSGIVRQFKVDAFAPPPTQRSNSATGWGVSIDALLPVIPAADGNDRKNRLTLTGSYVIGTGIADLLTTGGGAQFPTLPKPGAAIAAPDVRARHRQRPGHLRRADQHPAHDRLVRVQGRPAVLPADARRPAALRRQLHLLALEQHAPALPARAARRSSSSSLVADTSQYADANLFFDATPAIRFGISGQYTQVDYLATPVPTLTEQPHNIRGMGQAVYVF